MMRRVLVQKDVTNYVGRKGKRSRRTVSRYHVSRSSWSSEMSSDSAVLTVTSAASAN